MITREDIENIALLSKLFVDEKDIDGLTEEMQKIVAFADTINSVEVKSGEFDNINNLQNAFRADEVKESGDPEKRPRTGGGSLPRQKESVTWDRSNASMRCSRIKKSPALS